MPNGRTEADTCRTLITPKLRAAGWENDPHSFAEQRSFTDGRVVVRGSKAERRKGKRADYLLRYTRDFPIAVTEANLKTSQPRVECNRRKTTPKSSN
jgi:type I restriction enzyme R subunit